MNDGPPPLALGASPAERAARYRDVLTTIRALLEGEDDWIAGLATVVAELHAGFEYFDWTGVYRLVRPDLLVIGPYQGGHGCLRIAIERGVCGAAVRTRATQLVPDVSQYPDHIACSALTRSEIVVPIVAPNGRLLGVLDVDSNRLAAFGEVDREPLEELCQLLGRQFEAAPNL
ncbi:MAG: GAF domain-containing protein [Myxococcales bacterium]|nr:GAF domain-containing protein [Myxococcales bacterium]